MKIKKLSDVQSWSISREGEYAEFHVSHGYNGSHWLSFAGRSSFDPFGYFWSHMGQPWDAFLHQCNPDYFLNKIFAEAYEQDHEAERKNTTRSIIEARKKGYIDAEEARGFIQQINDREYASLWSDGYYERVDRIRPSYMRFYEVLYRPWIESIVIEQKEAA